MPASLLDFVRANDAAGATTKKLQKQAILAEYFHSLDEQDLRWAVRYAAGRAFASTDERTLNVGGAIIWDVSLALLGLDPAAWHDLIVKSGEVGEAIAKVWPAEGVTPLSALSQWSEDENSSVAASTFNATFDALQQHAPTGRSPHRSPLTLGDLAQSFDLLASTGNTQRKRDTLRELLSRCQTGREAAYVTKIISGDLRTGVQEGVLAAAVARAFAQPLDRVQRCQLLVGDLEEVAVLARLNALDTARFRLFHPLQFMLATPQDTPEIAAATLAGRTFWAEHKLDGIRAQIHKSGNRLAIYTRTMDRTEESFPDVVQAIARLPGDFLLDGEIVPFKEGRVLPFAHIQKRLGRKKLDSETLKENPAAFIPFDLLYRDGELLIDCPLRIRRERLTRLVQGTEIVEVSSAEQIIAAFELARESRNEGIVLKDPDSIYSPGRRGQAWLKLKTHLPTFDCVVTAAEYGHGKRRSVLSDYTFGVWTDDPSVPDAKLVNIGKAYSGVTDEEIVRLTELFLQISRQHVGRVHLVEPKIVLEIACDQIQKSKRHASGYALRFPRIKRIRWDKRPQDADRLAHIAEIYESMPNFGRSVDAPKVLKTEATLFD